MTKGITFGYLYDFRNPVQWRRPWAGVYAEIIEFAAWTESLGFEAAWVPEHHGSEDGYMPSPLVAMAAIAARTKKIRIGSGIALAPLYHPVRFAEDCAVADIISNGRLEVGVAVGYRRCETDAFGVDFGSRGRRMDDFMQIVRRLWAGENFSYRSKYFDLKNAFITPRPVRGHIPFYVGGFAPKPLERAAKYGDGYFGNAEMYDMYREKLLACGKDPASQRFLVQDIMVVVAEDPDKARHELGPYFQYVHNMYARWLKEDLPSGGSQSTAVFDAFESHGALRVMTPGQAIDMFKKMREQAPVEHVMLMVPPGLPLSKFAPYAEVLAKQVMPALRAI